MSSQNRVVVFRGSRRWGVGSADGEVVGADSLAHQGKDGRDREVGGGQEVAGRLRRRARRGSISDLGRVPCSKPQRGRLRGLQGWIDARGASLSLAEPMSRAFSPLFLFVPT